MTKGLIIAAASSGSGKTTVTLALLALLKRRGIAVASCKVGPDYIDPAFHARATGRPCFNLDGWAMRPATLAHLVRQATHDAELLVVEGVMGLFDGAPSDADAGAGLDGGDRGAHRLAGRAGAARQGHRRDGGGAAAGA